MAGLKLCKINIQTERISHLHSTMAGLKPGKGKVILLRGLIYIPLWQD